MINQSPIAYYNSPQTSYKKTDLHPVKKEKDRRMFLYGLLGTGAAVGAGLAARRAYRADVAGKLVKQARFARAWVDQKAIDSAIKGPWVAKTHIDDTVRVMLDNIQEDLARGSGDMVEKVGRMGVKWLADNARRKVGPAENIDKKAVNAWVKISRGIYKATGNKWTPREEQGIRQYLNSQYFLQHAAKEGIVLRPGSQIDTIAELGVYPQTVARRIKPLQTDYSDMQRYSRGLNEGTESVFSGVPHLRDEFKSSLDFGIYNSSEARDLGLFLTNATATKQKFQSYSPQVITRLKISLANLKKIDPRSHRIITQSMQQRGIRL